MRSALRAATLALAAVAGCAGSAPARMKPASAGVDAYLRALRSDDARAAYALLSAQVKQRMSYRQFAARWRQTKPERAQQALALAEALKTVPDLGERAELRFPDGRIVHLDRESSAWRLEAALVSRVHAGRPRDAVKMLSVALAQHDYEGVLQILTRRRRDALRHKVEGFISSLEKHQDDHIERIGGDRAELRWDDAGMRYRIVLRKQGDEWRIDDVYLHPAPAPPPKDHSGAGASHN